MTSNESVPVLSTEERINRAEQEVLRLCKGNSPGGRTFRMTIPVEPDDSDIVLIDGLKAGLEALSRIAVLEGAITVAYEYVAIEWKNGLIPTGSRDRLQTVLAAPARAALAPSRPEETPEPTVRCGNCGADLSGHPAAASGHICSHILPLTSEAHRG